MILVVLLDYIAFFHNFLFFPFHFVNKTNSYLFPNCKFLEIFHGDSLVNVQKPLLSVEYSDKMIVISSERIDENENIYEGD